MMAIVDYDNIPEIVRMKGPRSLAERLAALLSPLIPPASTGITFRLYGGWYSQTTLTQPAQLLHSALYDDFPFFWSMPPSDRRKVMVTASLAHALEINPKQTLPNTFRSRSRRRRGRWQLPSVGGCSNLQCALLPVIENLHADRCRVDSCTIRPSDLVTPEPEQKMVDTMMVADIIHIANRGDECVAVVTSDDDVWPGILSAMTAGTRVLHVQPKPSSMAWPYQNCSAGQYLPIQF